VARRSKKQEEAERFRENVQRLRSLGEIFREWEADWLDSEARRPADYVPSEKERVILNQIRAAAQTFDGYDGIAIPSLIQMAYRFRADLPYDDERFVEDLYRGMPRTLPLYALSRLVSIVRLTESIGKDELVDAALATTRARDEVLYEAPDFVSYAMGR
jgi:hypothetical protein